MCGSGAEPDGERFGVGGSLGGAHPGFWEQEFESISDTLAREFHDTDRMTTARTGRRPLSPRQYKVLQAVADQRVQRDTLLGTLESHLLDGEDVIWILRGLVIRGLVQLQPIGPPRLTRRDRRTLDSPD